MANFRLISSIPLGAIFPRAGKSLKDNTSFFGQSFDPDGSNAWRVDMHNTAPYKLSIDAVRRAFRSVDELVRKIRVRIDGDGEACPQQLVSLLSWPGSATIFAENRMDSVHGILMRMVQIREHGKDTAFPVDEEVDFEVTIIGDITEILDSLFQTIASCPMTLFRVFQTNALGLSDVCTTRNPLGLTTRSQHINAQLNHTWLALSVKVSLTYCQL